MNSLRTLKPYIRRHFWTFFFGILFVFLTNAIGLWVPIAIGSTVNLAEHRTISANTLGWLAIGIVCLAAIGGAFRFLMRRLIVDVSRDIEYEFRNDMFRKLENLDPVFFDNNNTGDLMSRATNDMDALRMLIGPAIMYACNTIFSMPMVLIGMIYLDWRLALVVTFPMLSLPFICKYFGSRQHVLSRAQQDSFGDLTTMVQENLAGIRVVKAYRQEAHERQKFLDRNDDYIKKSLIFAKTQAIFFPTIHAVVTLGYVLLLIFGGWRIIGGHMQIGTLLSFILLFTEMIWPLIAAGWVINIFQRGLASLERINMIFDAKSKVVDAPHAPEFETLPMNVEIRHLSFQYEGTERNQLIDISLTIPHGKTLGIVGPVGCGKSTLVNLLTRFYPVPRGAIFIGGRDINDWPLSVLRRRVAYVFQETFLFSDTIGWNIRFGGDDNTPQERVEEAARLAQIDSSIREFPKKYETVLGERGVNLSGGQKQRTSIARALAKGGDVLILDDSLSAVDTHTEEAILQGLATIMKGRSTILISHRISTVAMADEIIVIEEGRITQRGHHDELIAMPGLYAELFRKQLREQAVEHFGEAGEPAGVLA